MALNLSTLTNASTSATVLAEAQTTADFLDSVPILKNLARRSNKGGDGKQTTALNQPRSLPLIKNPSGKLGGYLYIPNVSGNYATGPSVTIGANETWEGEVDMVISQWGSYVLPMGGGNWDLGFGLIFYSTGGVRVFSKGIGVDSAFASGVTHGTTFNAKYGYDGTNLYVDIDGVRKFTTTAPSQSASITHPIQLNHQAAIANIGNYAIQKAKLTVNSSVVFDCDFNGSTSIRHNDTKFQCATGQTVTINQAGNDPATVIKKSVLRFDGVNDFFTGLLGQSIDSGHVFVSFSWLGSGGDSWARPFGVHKTGELDYASGGFVLRRFSSNENLIVTQNSGTLVMHLGMVDSELGDMLVDFKVSSGDTDSKINNADLKTSSATTDTDASNFNIAAMDDGQLNAAIDLEFLALFPATITDAEAARVVNYINNRNNVFDLKDSLGYYFFDPQSITDSDITSTLFTGDWDGRIVGSDLGDNTLEITQGTGGSQPVADKYKLTFADNDDHLLFGVPYTPPFPAGQDKAWQICGTSLGTFAYKINNNSQTELSLLGNLGSASYRKAGDLYGIILLPETATGADIEAARKLLIDRGASDGVTGSSLSTYWLSRVDIVEFKGLNTSGVNSFYYTWHSCSSLTSFPFIDTSSGASFTNAWNACAALTSFPALDMSSGATFQNAWRHTTALTSFPAGAKLGTAATGTITFDDAWQSSGLTSFSTPLPTATSASVAWGYCSALTQFNLDSLPVVLNVSQAWRNTGLTSFNTNLPSATSVSYAWYQATSLSSFGAVGIKNCTNFSSAWQGTTALTSFPAGAKLGTSAENVNFTNAFRDSGLTELPAGLDMSQGSSFQSAFHSCHSLATIGSGVLFGTANETAVVDFTSVFRTCDALVTIPANLDLSKGNDFQNAFRGCNKLVTFPAGIFDAIGTPEPNCFTNCWAACNKLSGASVDAILDSIEASGQSAPASGPDITITYNTATGTPLYDSVPSLFARGWNVMVNSVAVTNTSATDLIIDSMAISTLSVVSGLSPVYNRLGNPAEYGDNISRIGNLGTDANDPVQDVEGEQPVFRAVGNEADYGDGYLYLDGVAGSYASIPDPLGSLGDFTMQVDGLSPETVRPAAQGTLMSQWDGGGNVFILRTKTDGTILLSLYWDTGSIHDDSAIVPTDTVGIRITRVGTLITYWVDTGSGYVSHDTTSGVGDALTSSTAPFRVGEYGVGGQPLLGTISRAQIWDNGTAAGTAVVDADFRNATHKLTDTDTFVATSGQTITINGGATVYNPPIAPLHGYLHLSGGAGNYASVPDAAALDVTGDLTLECDFLLAEFPPTTDRVLVAKYNTGGNQRGYLFSAKSNGSLRLILSPDGIYDSNFDKSQSFASELIGGTRATVKAAWRQSDGRLQFFIKGSDGSFTQVGADQNILAASISSVNQEVEIGSHNGGTTGIGDPISVFGAKIYGSIDDTNKVLDVNFDTDPAHESNTSFTATSGQTVTIHQSTITGDRAKIVKNSEIFYDGQNDEFNFSLSSTFTGKMLVASTQGILVADVSRAGATQIDEKGVASITGFSAAHGLEQKGVMLLSDSSSPAALTSAFVARGAVKSFAARTTFTEAFRNMELTSFPTIDVSNGVDCSFAWDGYRGTTFPPLNFASATSLYAAWYNSTSLTSVSAIQAPVCTNFGSAWQNNTALATIDPNANFGESATGVNFSSAFRTTGLTALPAGLDMSQGFTFSSAFSGCGSLATIGTGVLLGTANGTATVNFGYVFKATGLTALPAGLDMSQGSVFTSAFQSCASLTTIGTGVLLGTASTNVSFQNAFLASGLTELPANLNMSQGDTFESTFQNCSSLTTIGNGVLLGTASSSVNFTNAFYGCTNLVTLPANLNLSSGNHFNKTFYNCSSLVDFPAGAFDTLGTPVSSCFFFTWLGCLALSTTSVENILSSINTSGQSAPAVGPEIFITYNVATGALSAATNTAIASLQGKGWTIVINGTTLLP
jgi:hypothetical protein